MADDSNTDNQHQLTTAQLEAIENEIKSTQPLTSQLLPIAILLQQYTTNANDDSTSNDQQAGFIKGANYLCTKYNSIRKIRGDGNCFYRGFMYSLCEQLLRSLLSDNNKDEFYRLKDVITKSLKWVCQYGYDETTIEMFYDELVELFDFIEGAIKPTDNGKDEEKKDSALLEQLKEETVLEYALEQLHTKLNEENATSDYCTWFMRVMTAAQMKSNPDEYLPFVMAENYHDVASFCSREVEPMAKECGMVQVAALAKCMGVKVVIEYMDGRMAEGEEKLVNHVFGEEENDSDKEERMSISLLYRPGHYDILY